MGLLLYFILIQIREGGPAQERVPLSGTGTQQTQPSPQSYLEPLPGRKIFQVPKARGLFSEVPDEAGFELPGGRVREPGGSLFPFWNCGQFQFT